MSKEIKSKIVPKLRFPEFRGSDDWEEKPLSSVCNSFSGGTPTTSQKEFYGGDIPFIRSAEISKDFTELFVTEEGLKNSSAKLVSKGDVLVALYGANSGDVSLAKIDGAINQAVLCLKSTENNSFVYQFLLFKKNWIVSTYIQGGQGNLSGDIIKSLKLAFPKLSEQQKIASCLSSLDEYVTAESQKLEALKTHKKGLMQQLFPAEGERVPKLRFPEFKFSGEWVFEKLGEVYSFISTNSFSRDNLNYKNGSIKNIHYGDIHTKFANLFDIQKEEVPFINLEMNIGKIKPECYCIEGDVVFADASEDLNDIGKSIELVNLNNEKLVSGMHTLLARQKQNKLVVGFGGILFKSNNVRTQIQRESQGTKVLGISSSRLEKLKIYYPKNEKEQQRIVDCLSSLDDLIT
ncbi:MAG TPA: restriction endonuclease subunit S, partial [Hanamia sp.]|nr:restriction endonuclease subunit S [Hanamia sp.]